MITVGLTGGIGSGKSAVAYMFEEEGASVIDFDHLARLVVEPDKPAWRDIIAYFGPEIILPDRTVNRAALAEIIFSDHKARKALEGFTHPRIFAKGDALIKAIGKEKPRSIVIVDVPLLFELRLQKKFDKITLVYVPRDVQIKRVMERDSLAREVIEKRLDAQMPIEEKKALCDYLINNEGSPGNTRGQVRKVLSELKELEKNKGVDPIGPNN